MFGAMGDNSHHVIHFDHCGFFKILPTTKSGRTIGYLLDLPVAKYILDTSGVLLGTYYLGFATLFLWITPPLDTQKDSNPDWCQLQAQVRISLSQNSVEDATAIELYKWYSKEVYGEERELAPGTRQLSLLTGFILKVEKKECDFEGCIYAVHFKEEKQHIYNRLFQPTEEQ